MTAREPVVRSDAPVTEPVAVDRTEAVRRDAVVERRSWYPTWGPGMIVGAIGAVAIIVSLFMSWQDPSVHPDQIPVAFLWDKTATSDPSLLILLIPIAVVALLGAVLPRAMGLRILAGIAMLVVVGAFIYQLDRALPDGFDVGDALDTGIYVGGIGGILAFVSGFVPDTWARKREVVRTVDDRAV